MLFGVLSRAFSIAAHQECCTKVIPLHNKATETRENWFKRASSVQNTLEALEMQIYRRTSNWEHFKSVEEKIKNEIDVLRITQFDPESAPQHQREVSEELSENTRRIGVAARNLYWGNIEK